MLLTHQTLLELVLPTHQALFYLIIFKGFIKMIFEVIESQIMFMKSML